MPFYGYAGIPSPEDPKTSIAGAVVKWLVAEDTMVKAGTTIAEVRIKDAVHDVVICFPALIEKLLTAEGQMSETDTSLLKWNADGESIPYGRAYFLTRKK